MGLSHWQKFLFQTEANFSLLANTDDHANFIEHGCMNGWMDGWMALGHIN